MSKYRETVSQSSVVKSFQKQEWTKSTLSSQETEIHHLAHNKNFMSQKIQSLF